MDPDSAPKHGKSLALSASVGARLRLLFRAIVPALLLAGLVLLAFWGLIWLPPEQVIGGRDLLYLFLHWWRFALQSLQQGELPLWNPYLFSGVPFIANPQPALFYPPTWLILLLPLTRAVGLLYLFHFWLAGTGMWAWLRAEGADGAGALFGAVAFAFSGYFFARVYAGHIGVVMTQAWLPLILWALQRAVQRGRWEDAVLGGLPVAMALLAGHTASFYYVALVAAVYALCLAWERRRAEGGWRAFPRALALPALMGLTGLALAAVQLIPTLEFLRLSTRQGTDYAFAASYAWSPGYLLTLLVPYFFGEPVRIGYWGDGPFEEFVLYAGLLPLLLALLVGWRLRHRRTPMLLGLGGAGLLLALGPFAVLHRLAFHFLPLFGATRAPARAGFLFVFAVAALGGLALSWLRQQPEKAGRLLRRWMRGPAPWLVGGWAALVILAGFVLFALQRDSNPDVGRLWHVAHYTALFLLFFLLTMGLLGAWGTRRLSLRLGTALAVGLLLIDLWSWGRPLVQPAAVTESALWRGVAELTAGEEGRVLPWGLGIFEHNHGMALGIESVFGYDPLELERYYRFTTAVVDPRARAYDLLGARYLVAAQPMDFADEEGAPRLIGEQGGAWVYERPTALPRAWLVHGVEVAEGEALLARLNDAAFDPRTVALLEETPPCQVEQATGAEEVYFRRVGNNRVEVVVRAEAAGVLVIGEPDYPGWRAHVDGQAVPLLRADYALRAVCVPAGEHRLTLVYAPLSLGVGAVMTLLALLGTWWAAWRKKPAAWLRAGRV